MIDPKKIEDALSNIDAVIFDFGGVLLDLDYSKTENAFKELGVLNFSELYSQAKQSSIFDDLERGKIGPAAFHDFIRTRADQGLRERLTSEAINHAWSQMLRSIPSERLAFVDAIKYHRPTFLLSNTNDIHIDAFEAEIERVHGKKYFYSLFKKIYYSSRHGMRKPDAEFYELVLEEQKLDPARTLFIDDHAPNITGANAVGIRTHFLDLKSGMKLLEIF